jgi:deoxyribodipyrimidine photolyase
MKDKDTFPDSPVVAWFRKSLRLDDNHALHATAQSGRSIIPLYIREPPENGNGSRGAAQARWLHYSLKALARSFRSRGSRLILRSGMPVKFIHRPFEAPESMLKAAGVSLGKTYPKPLGDHAKARERALRTCGKTKDAA